MISLKGFGQSTCVESSMVSTGSESKGNEPDALILPKSGNEIVLSSNGILQSLKAFLMGPYLLVVSQIKIGVFF